ncbi:MAG: hypothetical protein JST22_04565 [Bacteroidetes bacterium]|nr:hypothetical protein [Bacteroidota bacterium]
MIHVEEQPEPKHFDAKVRAKGLKHLKSRKIALAKPLPPKTEINSYWRDCLDDLYRSYNGVCAYLCVYFERAIGAGSVDHFIAKSTLAGEAYEWSNFRLACSTMNSRKRAYDDVLDPFEIGNGWFRLELVSGAIYPNPGLPKDRHSSVQRTIDRLGLDDPGNREMRARHFQLYLDEMYKPEYLRTISPFVWMEAQRQGLL